jgi:GTP-binding protein HflX
VDSQRKQGRRARERSETPVVGLVGYTNAGKSTLINALTGAGVYAADQLFATLDPTLRRLELGPMGGVLLADTVGFVRDLPHELVAAFKSTLQETVEADLLLHVIDSSDERMEETIEEVERVIEEIGASDVPRIRVLNKIDRLDDPQPMIRRNEQGQIAEIAVSAHTGLGLGLLADCLRERFFGQMLTREFHLSSRQGDIRARLYRNCTVLRDQTDESGGWLMKVEGSRENLRFLDAGLADAVGDAT